MTDATLYYDKYIPLPIYKHEQFGKVLTAFVRQTGEKSVEEGTNFERFSTLGRL